MVDFGEDVADEGVVMMANVSYKSNKKIQVVCIYKEQREKSEKIYFLPYHLVYKYTTTAEEKMRDEDDGSSIMTCVAMYQKHYSFL